MPRIGWPELVIILGIVLLIFGAGRLPEIASSVGKAIRSFRSAATGLEEDKPARSVSRRKGSGKPTPKA